MNQSDLSHTADSAKFYNYVGQQAAIGAAVGTVVSTGTVAGLYYNTPWFKKFTNTSARAFLVFAGAGIGFSLASDWAMIHFYRYVDRPFLSKFDELTKEQRAKQMSQDKTEMLKLWAWDNRFRFIGGAWALTIGGLLARSYSNPHLSFVQKFGTARIAAQFVTLGAVIGLFAFNEDSGLFGKQHKRE